MRLKHFYPTSLNISHHCPVQHERRAEYDPFPSRSRSSKFVTDRMQFYTVFMYTHPTRLLLRYLQCCTESRRLVISGNACDSTQYDATTCLMMKNSHYKAWTMIGLHPMCAAFYTAGYTLREYGAFNYLYSPTNLNVFIVSQVMIYICPLVYIHLVLTIHADFVNAVRCSSWPTTTC